LVVEDEDGLSGAIQEWLQDEHYVVTVESDGREALNKLRNAEYELVLLDWMLPNISGLEICQRFRAAGGITPILMITAKEYPLGQRRRSR
jgi:DNA-binding response OmpR family regulator